MKNFVLGWVSATVFYICLFWGLWTLLEYTIDCATKGGC